MISEIVWKEPFMKRVLLFQSLSQVLGWLAVLVVAFAVILGISALGGDAGEGIKYFPVAVLGAIPSLYFSLPCMFEVATSNRSRLASDIELLAFHFGYQLSDKVKIEENSVTYISKLPKFLQWSDNNICVRKEPEVTAIQAPRVVVRRLRAKLVELGY